MLTKIYDPASPAEPGEILAANFDPAKHQQWRYRPAVLPIPWADLTVQPEDADEPVPLVTPDQASALAVEFPDLRALAAGDPTKVNGVGKAAAASIAAWAAEQIGYTDALAELEAETEPEPAEEASTTDDETVTDVED